MRFANALRLEKIVLALGGGAIETVRQTGSGFRKTRDSVALSRGAAGGTD